jgi:hypothetical protein
MNFVLPDNVRPHHVSAQHQSTRRMLGSTLKISGTNVASTLLATVALTISGCSSAEGSELDAPTNAAAASVEEQGLEVIAESDARLETTDSESVGSDGPSSPPAAEPTSPRGGAEAQRAPAATTSAREAETAPAERPVSAPAPVQRATMQTSGRQLLDTCGNPFVARGVEQIFGEQLPVGNDWRGLVEEIAASGVNTVRILANTDTLDTQDVDALLGVVKTNGMVAYITPYGDEGMRWLERQDVRQMLARHEKYILIDAFGEPTFDDRDRFLAESTRALREVRSWGYRVPLTVTANQYGRDLPSLFELGAEIIAADPLNNTVLGWQAYWSQNGYYQRTYGMSLTEAVEEVARAPFPIQLGLDRVTDFPATDTADFGALLSATEANGVGWLWWDWYNPYGNENNLTENGSSERLTPTGQTVLTTHDASVKNTSQPLCIR